MDPPTPCSYAHPALIPVEDASLQQGGFQPGFPLRQMLMATGHKPEDTPAGELDAQKVLKLLARSRIGDKLTSE